MLPGLILPLLLGIQEIPTQYVEAPPSSQVPAADAPPAQPEPKAVPSAVPPAKKVAAPASNSQNLKSLSFHSQRFSYKWNTTMPLNIDVDGLKVNTIFFNRREVKKWPLKGAIFGTRAQVEVTNTAKTPRVPGFAVAVFDKEDRLLGVASGGTRIGTVSPGDTETFDLNFRLVSARLELGDYFVLSVELATE